MARMFARLHSTHTYWMRRPSVIRLHPSGTPSCAQTAVRPHREQVRVIDGGFVRGMASILAGWPSAPFSGGWPPEISQAFTLGARSTDP